MERSRHGGQKISAGWLAAVMEGWARLDLGELERRPVRVALGPAPSLFALAADAAGAQRGAPRDWLARVRAELEPRDLATLSPLAVRPGGFTPASVMPRQGRTEAELFAELDRIAELPADDLLADIAFARGPAPNGPWATVARHPRTVARPVRRGDAKGLARRARPLGPGDRALRARGVAGRHGCRARRGRRAARRHPSPCARSGREPGCSPTPSSRPCASPSAA